MSIGKNIVDPQNLPKALTITNGKFNDVSNTYINNILFLYPCERRNKRLLWLCQCYCGNYFIVEPKSVRIGNTKSCGCRFKQRMYEYNLKNSEDLTGCRFGKLTVLERGYVKNARYYWKCQCDCGNISYACGSDLKEGKIHSCGCLQSYAEYCIRKLLDDNQIQYQQQYSFNDCRSVQNYLLRFDFAIFNQNQLLGLIEYQGQQHYDPTNNWYTINGTQNDQIKQDYCKQHNIPLILLYKGYDANNLLTEIRGWYPMSVGI